MSSCTSATQYLSVTEGRRLKVMPGWWWWWGAVYHELLNPVSVPAVGLLINSSGELCVKGYKRQEVSWHGFCYSVGYVAVQPQGVAVTSF